MHCLRRFRTPRKNTPWNFGACTLWVLLIFVDFCTTLISFCCPSCLSAFLPASSTAAIPGEYLANGITRPTKMQGDVHDVGGGGDVPPQASSIKKNYILHSEVEGDDLPSSNYFHILFTFFSYFYHIFRLRTQIWDPKIIFLSYSWSYYFHIIFILLYIPGLDPLSIPQSLK